MTQPPVRDAWCSGRPVQVQVRPSPPDHRRVACRTCGVAPGRECIDLVSRQAHYEGHAVRQRAAAVLHGAERS